MTEIFDLAIIGGGPEGVAAGVYSARKKINTILITENFRGQSAVSGEIQNWIGDISISGEELHKRLEKHLKYYSKDINIKEGEIVSLITKNNDTFLITTNKNTYQTKTVLIATGNIRKKIQVKGASDFEGKGITYCTTCDGPMFSGMDVAVIGGGNSAFEAASQLLAYTRSVTIIQRSEFRAEPIFVEIGSNPSVEFVKNGIVKLDEKEQIIIDSKTQKTSTEGIWSAGDCTDGFYRQNNIAVGDAIKAVENIYRFLKS